jgi:hypothetical protein
MEVKQIKYVHCAAHIGRRLYTWWLFALTQSWYGAGIRMDRHRPEATTGSKLPRAQNVAGIDDTGRP